MGEMTWCLGKRGISKTGKKKKARKKKGRKREGGRREEKENQIFWQETKQNK